MHLALLLLDMYKVDGNEKIPLFKEKQTLKALVNIVFS